MIFTEQKKDSNSGLFTLILSRFSRAREYHNKSNYRRYLLLNASLLICGTVLFFFIGANILRGNMLVAVAEVGAFILCLFLLYLVQSPRYLKLGSRVFFGVGWMLSLFVCGSPDTPPSIFVLNTVGPLFAFLLLGRRLGLPVTVLMLTSVAILFTWKYGFPPNAVSLLSVLHVTTLILGVAVFSYYHEVTRSETERALARDIAERRRAEKEKEKLIRQLRHALAEVTTLSGLLPICSSCKKIRDDEGYWNQIEMYLQKHSGAQFSHGICPDCAQRLYPEIYRKSDDGVA